MRLTIEWRLERVMSDRKYRHRGYMDNDRDDRERQPSRRIDERGRPTVDGAPRGRGVGTPTAVAFKCARCGSEIRDLSVEPETPCPSCGKRYVQSTTRAIRKCPHCGIDIGKWYLDHPAH